MRYGFDWQKRLTIQVIFSFRIFKNLVVCRCPSFLTHPTNITKYLRSVIQIFLLCIIPIIIIIIFHLLWFLKWNYSLRNIDSFESLLTSSLRRRQWLRRSDEVVGGWCHRWPSEVKSKKVMKVPMNRETHWRNSPVTI